MTNDVRFSVPAAWQDRSVHVLVAVPAAPPPLSAGADGTGDGAAGPPTAPPALFSVTLHSDVPRPGEDVAAYARRQLAQLEAAIPDLDVLRQGPRAVGGSGEMPGWELECRWIAPAGRLRQHQVYALRDGPGGRRILTWTASGLARLYLNYADDFAALLDSVRIVPSVVLVRPSPPTLPPTGRVES